MYSNQFYDAIYAGSLASAKEIVPRIVELVQPKSVIDVGCGEGLWLSVFSEYGAEIQGLDGEYVTPKIPRQFFETVDFESDWTHDKRYDLAVSLEVAEHISESRADSFIEKLTSLSDIVLFSAAIPYQGGMNHINEQWPRYWYDKFVNLGYVGSGALRFEFWNNDNIENWYRQNLFIFVKRRPPGDEITTDLQALLDSPLSYPWSLVHPFLWTYHRTLVK